MGRHPIQTAQGLGTAVAHPIQTGKAVIQDISEKSGTNRGQGALVGDVLIGIATGGSLKALSKTATVAKITSKVKGIVGRTGAAAKTAAEAIVGKAVGAESAAVAKGIAPSTARAVGDAAPRFNPSFETSVNASKTGQMIEQQMDRITGRVAQRMGIQNAEDQVMFRMSDEFGEVFGGSGYLNGSMTVDSGVLSPRSVLNAPELSQLGLRSRSQVILTHEAEEIPLLQQLRDPRLSHPLTVREGAPTSPLRVSPEAANYLQRWGELGPFQRGMR
ncbi:hypothetical protein V5E97_18200 [Singulisphaera sp. Ch08]|uniref:Uncharacterized protein n=1 Tax=Singulisphaera sp. Ch08 TaxID=3120278 RepID=A0AAU7CRZ0_9BACT